MFLSLLSINTVYAQIPTEQGDVPIDPNALKNANPSDLMNYLKDNNQQSKKPGEDIHKSNQDNTNKNIIIKDSIQKDNNGQEQLSTTSKTHLKNVY